MTIAIVAVVAGLVALFVGSFLYGLIKGVRDGEAYVEPRPMTEGNLTITLPPFWRPLPERRMANGQLSAGDPLNNAYVQVAYPSAADFSGSLEALQSWYTAGVAGQLSNAEVSAPQSASLAGTPALDVVVTGTNDRAQRITYLLRHAVLADEALVMVFVCESKDYAGQEATFLAIAESAARSRPSSSP